MRPKLLTCIRDKNVHELRRTAEAAGLSRQGTDALCRLGTLAGPWQEVLAAAEELAEGRSTAYGTSGELLLVEFNQRTDEASGGNALLLDKTVREAVTLCVDRETLALTGFGGAMPAYGFSVPYGTEGSAAAVCSAESAAV